VQCGVFEKTRFTFSGSFRRLHMPRQRLGVMPSYTVKDGAACGEDREVEKPPLHQNRRAPFHNLLICLDWLSRELTLCARELAWKEWCRRFLPYRLDKSLLFSKTARIGASCAICE
jgi:hypothetical protein